MFQQNQHHRESFIPRKFDDARNWWQQNQSKFAISRLFRLKVTIFPTGNQRSWLVDFPDSSLHGQKQNHEDPEPGKAHQPRLHFPPTQSNHDNWKPWSISKSHWTLLVGKRNREAWELRKQHENRDLGYCQKSIHESRKHQSLVGTRRILGKHFIFYEPHQL